MEMNTYNFKNFVNVGVKILDKNIDTTLPKYETAHSSGMDIRTVETKTINPDETVIFRTNIAFDIPLGYDIKIYSRSGLAARNSIFVLNAPAVIDKDYVGEIMIILHNVGKYPVIINSGDRIAQCILEQKHNMVLSTVDELPLTERGDGGFGSTGLK